MKIGEICLKNLNSSLRREVFDQVKAHLLTQKKKSLSSGFGDNNCVYRSTDGLSCAAGCLIREDEYNKGMENRQWRSLTMHNEVPKRHLDLIERLQEIHDYYEPERWEMELNKLEKCLDDECEHCSGLGGRNDEEVQDQWYWCEYCDAEVEHSRKRQKIAAWERLEVLKRYTDDELLEELNRRKK